MNQSESSLCRVFLVDDDLLVLDDLRELIAWEAEGFEIIGTAGNGEQALAQLARTPGGSGFRRYRDAAVKRTGFYPPAAPDRSAGADAAADRLFTL